VSTRTGHSSQLPIQNIGKNEKNEKNGEFKKIADEKIQRVMVQDGG
jgi:hypothetical protein